MDIPIFINWDDNNNIGNRRPSEITVHLYAGGVEVDSRQFNEENNWENIFDEKLIFNPDYTKILYTITSSTIENYAQNIDYDDIQDGVTITYTYHPPEVTKTIQVNVTGDITNNPIPPIISVNLLENNQTIGTYNFSTLDSSFPQSISISGLNADNNYDASFPTITGYTLTKSINGDVISGLYEPSSSEVPERPPR